MLSICLASESGTASNQGTEVKCKEPCFLVLLMNPVLRESLDALDLIPHRVPPTLRTIAEF